jgi:hypothetical protein
LVDGTLARIQELVGRGEYLISEHGREELAADDIGIGDVLSGVSDAEVIESYPDAWKGPSVLVLQRDRAGRPIHVVWGLPREILRPAALVTAYRPDERRWTEGFKRRKDEDAPEENPDS